jgi:hypothetical protein
LSRNSAKLGAATREMAHSMIGFLLKCDFPH